MLGLVKAYLRLEKGIEMHKEILSQNSNYAHEVFRFFDVENKGYITEADFAEKFGEFDVQLINAKLISKYDRDGDGNLSFREFTEMVTPLNRDYQGSEYLRGSGSRHSSPGRFYGP